MSSALTIAPGDSSLAWPGIILIDTREIYVYLRDSGGRDR